MPFAADRMGWRRLAHPRPPCSSEVTCRTSRPLIDRGQKAVLRSTVPTHSWAAWLSFLTGVDPAGHHLTGERGHDTRAAT